MEQKKLEESKNILKSAVQCGGAFSGYTAGMLDSIKLAVDCIEKQLEQKNLDLATEVCMELFGEEPPCNFNCMDEYADEWCELHCDNYKAKDCWKHAIEKGWYRRSSTCCKK